MPFPHAQHKINQREKKKAQCQRSDPNWQISPNSAPPLVALAEKEQFELTRQSESWQGRTNLNESKVSLSA